jgi:hypothetical protein
MIFRNFATFVSPGSLPKFHTAMFIRSSVTIQTETKKFTQPRYVHSQSVLCQVPLRTGARGGAVFEALRYKPEGRGIDSRWCHWNFSLT